VVIDRFDEPAAFGKRASECERLAERTPAAKEGAKIPALFENAADSTASSSTSGSTAIRVRR
jgi:hypothetical protein